MSSFDIASRSANSSFSAALTKQPRIDAGTAPGDRAFRPDIEGLRAVAVLLVVCFHGALFHVVGGYIGVDVFFVISGYVITGFILREHASDRGLSLVKFYSRRALRLVPMACFVAIAAVFAQSFLVGSGILHQDESAARWSMFFLANVHSNLLLGIYWSLAIEVQFYLFYPLIVIPAFLLLTRWSPRAKLGGLLIVVAVLSFVWSRYHPVAAYGSPWGRAWEFAAGALISVSTGPLRRVPVWLSASMTWFGLGSLVALGLTLSFTPDYSGRVAVFPVLATMLIIAGGTPAPRFGAEGLLRLPPFKFLGRWSYSLYLWHWPIIVVVVQIWGRVGATSRFLTIGFAVALSALSYTFIENPVRQLAFLRKRPWLSIASGFLLLALCALLTFAL